MDLENPRDVSAFVFVWSDLENLCELQFLTRVFCRGNPRTVKHRESPGTLSSLRLSVGKSLPSPIQSVPIPSERFFFVTDSPSSLREHLDASLSGVFGCNGSHGEST